MAQTADKPATKARILADDHWHQVGDRLLRQRTVGFVQRRVQLVRLGLAAEGRGTKGSAGDGA